MPRLNLPPALLDRLDRIPVRKLAIAAGGVVGAVIVLYAVASTLVDAQKLQELTQAQVKLLTGRDLTVKGEVVATLLPSPHITLSRVELTPPADEKPEQATPALRADMLTIHVSWGSLFSELPTVTKVTLAAPVLEVQKNTDGTVRWDWLAVLGGGLENAGQSGFTLTLENGRISYLNALTDTVQRAENIALALGYDTSGAAVISGGLTYMGQNFQLSGSVTAPAEGAGAPVVVRFWLSDDTYVQFKGEKTAVEGGFTLKGALEAKAADITAWTRAPESQAPPYPAALTGTLEWSGNTLSLTEASLESTDSAAKGKLALVLADMPDVAAELHFSRLKFGPAVIASLFAAPVLDPTLPSSVATYAKASATTLPAHMRAAFIITAEDVFFGTYHLASATFTGSLKEAALQIDRLSAVLPGESQILLSGNVTDTTKGARFQGIADLSGKQLKTLLVTMEPAATQLPEKGFTEFSLKGNFFLSSEQMRLSEATLNVDQLSLLGGLVTYFEATPRIEAEVSLNGTNLDYFRDSWREEAKTNEGSAFIFKINSSVDFSWLRSLKPIIDLKINLNQFTFLDHQGTNAAFRVYAKQNEFGFYNLEMNYPDGMLKGKLKLNVAAETPSIEISMEAPWFDTAYFARDPAETGTRLIRPEGAPEDRWSKELFDFNWMIGVASQFNFNISRLTYKGILLDKFMIEGALAGEQLQFKKLSFEQWGGRIDAVGNLIGGKVPGLSASFTIYNIDLAEIIRTFTPMNKVSGRASMSGTLVTSGINFISWVQQAEAKIVLAGRGIRTQGFNVQGIIDGVNAARSVAEVVDNVTRALPSGTTDFSVDGNINIGKGVMRTPGMAIAAGRVVASLSGELQLLPWKMVLNMMFQFPMLQSETVPTLTVDVVGSPEDYSFKFDTSSLEAYVAKRIVGR